MVLLLREGRGLRTAGRKEGLELLRESASLDVSITNGEFSGITEGSNRTAFLFDSFDI